MKTFLALTFLTACGSAPAPAVPQSTINAATTTAATTQTVLNGVWHLNTFYCPNDSSQPLTVSISTTGSKIMTINGATGTITRQTTKCTQTYPIKVATPTTGYAFIAQTTIQSDTPPQCSIDKDLVNIPLQYLYTINGNTLTMIGQDPNVCGGVSAKLIFSK